MIFTNSEFYGRLLENGKLKKVALVAVMRKMLVILNAIQIPYLSFAGMTHLGSRPNEGWDPGFRFKFGRSLAV